MFYTSQGLAIACCTLFYNLLSFEKFILPCDDDPNEQMMSSQIQAFLRAAFYIHAVSLFLSASVFPYFDNYSNFAVLVQRDLASDQDDFDQKRSKKCIQICSPYISLLEHAFKVLHAVVGAI